MTSSRHARLPSFSLFLLPSLYFILCHIIKRLSIYLSLLPRAPISLSIFLSTLFARFLSLFHSYWQASCMHKSLPLFRSITLVSTKFERPVNVGRSGHSVPPRFSEWTTSLLCIFLLVSLLFLSCFSQHENSSPPADKTTSPAASRALSYHPRSNFINDLT